MLNKVVEGACHSKSLLRLPYHLTSFDQRAVGRGRKARGLPRRLTTLSLTLVHDTSPWTVAPGPWSLAPEVQICISCLNSTLPLLLLLRRLPSYL